MFIVRLEFLGFYPDVKKTAKVLSATGHLNTKSWEEWLKEFKPTEARIKQIAEVAEKYQSMVLNREVKTLDDLVNAMGDVHELQTYTKQYLAEFSASIEEDRQYRTGVSQVNHAILPPD